METIHWSFLFGGFTFFFFGLTQARLGLEALAGGRMRTILGKIASNRILALLFGAFVTIMLQSSGATSVMLISFVESQLLTLTQAIAVLLGADIGTTFTVFLLSIRHMSDYSLTVIFIGFLMQGLIRRGRLKYFGRVLLGFGFVFYGMSLMSDAALPLKESASAQEVLSFFADNPLVTLLVGIVFSIVLHSAGTLGVAIALAFSGNLTLETALPLVLGANIGTCVTALMCGLHSNYEGRRVAIAHILSKMIAVCLVFPFLPTLTTFIQETSFSIRAFLPKLDPGVPGQIVMAHILFNGALALFFLPLIAPLRWLSEKLIPEPKELEEFRPKYLDAAALHVPALAFAQVKQEILRLGGFVQQQLKKSLKMLSRGVNAYDEIEEMGQEDDKIDELEKAIRFYLAKISVENLSEEEARRQLALLTIGQDFEEIGDTLSKEMVALAKKKAERHGIFSDAGWNDLKSFHKSVCENFELAMEILTHAAPELKERLQEHVKSIERKEQQLRQSHLNRLSQGLKESFDTSSIHLDVLSTLGRINGKISHIVHVAEEL
ncbi:MAG: hypothetical protein A3I05_08880 [Deltaproteobacteria bacterium RIFCSPLOWO2_02_FULL_44_10]|nr:MAG: hypothetical protein A3C46_08735 [Deltaproteobacteria bacterium RIFCSPHIGHO2_02_FULL_44_16]OGQ45221.1 MAG: hypothetical protein A3I05_08880 [Deltaproteobacteria bacterium RIFCSPLOWO2_02_FULL_44_10]